MIQRDGQQRNRHTQEETYFNHQQVTVLVALIVAFGGFLMGFDASVISGVVGFIGPEFGLTKLQVGWAVSFA